MGAEQSHGSGCKVRDVIPPDRVHSFEVKLSRTSELPSTSDRFTHSSGESSHDLDADMEKLVQERYTFGKIIGKGASAPVYVVTELSTGQDYACKVVKKNSRMNDSLTMTAEMRILKSLQHENIAGLHELFEGPNEIWIVMELVNGGRLQDRLVTEHPSDYGERVVAKYFKQILRAVHHLHSQGIVHRDLKADNILCNINPDDNSLTVKLTDFGLSTIVPISQCHFPNAQQEIKHRKRYRKLKQQWGTPEHFSPEVYKRSYGPQVDIWSLGCVLYEMLTGETPFPFKERVPSKVEKLLMQGFSRVKRAYEMRETFKLLSVEAQDLIRNMLKRDPQKRFSVEECISHPWISGGAATLKPILLQKAFAINYRKHQTKLRNYEALVKATQFELNSQQKQQQERQKQFEQQQQQQQQQQTQQHQQQQAIQYQQHLEKHVV